MSKETRILNDILHKKECNRYLQSIPYNIAKDIHAIHQSIEFSLKHTTPWKTYTHTNLSHFKNILITPCMPPEYKAIKQNQKQANFQ